MRRRATGVGRAALVGLGLLLAAGACRSAPREPLRIGVNVWPPYELLYLARERGFFEQEGVDVELVDFSSYTGVLRAYHQGQIDGLLATLNEIQVRDNFQDPPVVVLVVDYSFGGDAVVARSGIESLAALRGRRVAYEESALGSYVLERALAAGGLRAADVRLHNRLPEEGEEDFRAEAVDAVVTYEPFLGRMVRDAGARVLFSSRDMPGEIVDVFALRRATAERRADDARRVMRAWFRALAELRVHPQEAAAIMARREGVSADELLRALESCRFPDRRENRRLMGGAGRPGTLMETTARLAEFLERHGLARRAGRGPELLLPGLLEAL